MAVLSVVRDLKVSFWVSVLLRVLYVAYNMNLTVPLMLVHKYTSTISTCNCTFFFFSKEHMRGNLIYLYCFTGNMNMSKFLLALLLLRVKLPFNFSLRATGF